MARYKRANNMALSFIEIDENIEQIKQVLQRRTRDARSVKRLTAEGLSELQQLPTTYAETLAALDAIADPSQLNYYERAIYDKAEVTKAYATALITKVQAAKAAFEDLDL